MSMIIPKVHVLVLGVRREYCMKTEKRRKEVKEEREVLGTCKDPSSFHLIHSFFPLSPRLLILIAHITTGSPGKNNSK